MALKFLLKILLLCPANLPELRVLLRIREFWGLLHRGGFVANREPIRSLYYLFGLCTNRVLTDPIAVVAPRANMT
jgi:hypothetical protein